MSNAPDPISSERRPGRGLRIALILSLALNLAVAGLVLGLVLSTAEHRRGGPGEPPSVLRSMGLGPATMALSRDSRSELRARLRDNRSDLVPLSRDLGLATRSFAGALRAEPFDPEAVAAALEAQRSAGVSLQAVGHGILVEHLATMSHEDRVQLADRVDRTLRRAVGRAMPTAQE